MQESEIRQLNTGELVRRLISNMSTLVDRETDLAKQEAKSDAVQVGFAVAGLAAGGLLIYTAVVALIVALVVWLGAALYPWAVALIVAGVFAILGIVAALIGLSRVKVRPLARTRRTIKEDIQWVRAQMTSQAR